MSILIWVDRPWPKQSELSLVGWLLIVDCQHTFWLNADFFSLAYAIHGFCRRQRLNHGMVYLCRPKMYFRGALPLAIDCLSVPYGFIPSLGGRGVDCFRGPRRSGAVFVEENSDHDRQRNHPLTFDFLLSEPVGESPLSCSSLHVMNAVASPSNWLAVFLADVTSLASYSLDRLSCKRPFTCF